MQQMQEHVERYEASIVFDHIDSVDLEPVPLLSKAQANTPATRSLLPRVLQPNI